MTAPRADDASGMALSAASEAEQREIVRRAELLCRRAEPHTESVPCPAHLHEAQRQLFGPAA